MLTSILNLTYLIGALAFVIGLRRLSSPDTARRGNIMAAIGMGLAIAATLVYPFQDAPNNYAWIIVGMIIGGAIGWVSAKKVKMTAMPQMVSIFNGLGGACAVALAMVEFRHYYHGQFEIPAGELFAIILALLIGAIAFTGSILAYLKLDGKVWDSQVTLPKHSVINIILLIITLALSGFLLYKGLSAGMIMAVVVMAVALVYGFSFVALWAVFWWELQVLYLRY